jgi:peroxiredoxin
MKKILLKSIFFVLSITTTFAQKKVDTKQVKNEVPTTTKTAIDFSLKNVDDKMVSLADFKEQKGVIVTFVTNTCPVAEMNQARIEALQQKYAAKGFPVLAINPSDDLDAMKKIATERKYSYAFLSDVKQTVSRNFRAIVNTYTVVLQKTADGFTIVYEGAIDDDYSGENVKKKYVENAVDALLANKVVAVAKTKALGCPIKYKK